MKLMLENMSADECAYVADIVGATRMFAKSNSGHRTLSLK